MDDSGGGGGGAGRGALWGWAASQLMLLRPGVEGE